jgi:D-alanyl-D-alanine carboxypeptidase (penicillin-binding protein 5/6)
MRTRTILFALVGLLASAPPSAAIETVARQAVLMDFSTRVVLYEKDADARTAPASLSKMMTAYLVFEAIRDGRLALDQKLVVSERAWRARGSRMFLEPGDRVAVEDLLRGLIVQSGNDAAVVLAEALAGSEAAFAARMTAKAHALGMTRTRFVNASGWPDPGHYSTARDLAILARAMIEAFPKLYRYHAERSFTYGGIEQRNRNPLLWRDAGADGIKTGFTEEGGYGIAASAVQDGRRLVLVENGLPSKRARAQESWRLLQWGFRTFAPYRLFEAGEEVERAPTWLGAEGTVPLVLDEDLVVPLSREQRRNLEVSVAFEAPIPAPIVKGTPLGTLRVAAPGLETMSLPLKAGADVGEMAPVERAATLAGKLLLGWLGEAAGIAFD